MKQHHHHMHYFKTNRFKHDLRAGITTYVIIMFGVATMLYMFGYTSVWQTYTKQASAQGAEDTTGIRANQTNITSPEYSNFIGQIISTLANPLSLAFAGAAGVTLLALAVGKLTGNGMLLTTVVPIIWLMVFLNIFVFPIGAISTDVSTLNIPGIQFNIFILGFFNLFMVLSIFEYITGRP